jgi:transcriptional regulator of acetoin/glycerol metabolism
MTETELLELQKQNMLAALQLCDWRVSGPNGAAKLIGLKSTTFNDRMKKYGLAKPRPRPGRAA